MQLLIWLFTFLFTRFAFAAISPVTLPDHVGPGVSFDMVDGAVAHLQKVVIQCSIDHKENLGAFSLLNVGDSFQPFPSTMDLRQADFSEPEPGIKIFKAKFDQNFCNRAGHGEALRSGEQSLVIDHVAGKFVVTMHTTLICDQGERSIKREFVRTCDFGFTRVVQK